MQNLCEEQNNYVAAVERNQKSTGGSIGRNIRNK